MAASWTANDILDSFDYYYYSNTSLPDRRTVQRRAEQNRCAFTSCADQELTENAKSCSRLFRCCCCCCFVWRKSIYYIVVFLFSRILLNRSTTRIYPSARPLLGTHLLTYSIMFCDSSLLHIITPSPSRGSCQCYSISIYSCALSSPSASSGFSIPKHIDQSFAAVFSLSSFSVASASSCPSIRFIQRRSGCQSACNGLQLCLCRMDKTIIDLLVVCSACR